MHPLIPFFEQPVIHLGPVPLYGFGVMVALGFLVGGQVAMARARKLGLDPDAINRLIGWLVIGTFVGGHLGYLVMYKPSELFDPVRLINVFDGLSSFGGFFACVPITVWFFKKEKLPLWPYLDCLGHGLTIGWLLGRGGCFLAHDHPGPPTNFWLGVYGICPGLSEDIACHDLGLYESLFGLVSFFIFTALDRVPRVPGFYALLLGLLYAPTRLGLDFLRPTDTDPRWAGLTGAQWGSVLFLVVCVVLMVRRLQSGDEPAWTDRWDKLEPLNARIEANGEDVEARLERAELYKSYGNQAFATADVEAVLKAEPNNEAALALKSALAA